MNTWKICRIETDKRRSNNISRESYKIFREKNIKLGEVRKIPGERRGNLGTLVYCVDLLVSCFVTKMMICFLNFLFLLQRERGEMGEIQANEVGLRPVGVRGWPFFFFFFFC